MMRRIHLFMIMCVLAAGSLQAQLWERIANPFGGPHGTYTVAEVDGWTVVAGSASAAIWRTRTPEQMGSMVKIIVEVDGVRMSISDMIEHRGRLFARRGRGFIVSDDAGATWSNLATLWPIDCSQSPSTQAMDLHATQDALFAWCELSGPWRSTDGGITWKDLRPIPPSESRQPLRDAAFGTNLLVVLDGPDYDPVLRVSTDDGVTWTACAKPPVPQNAFLQWKNVSIGSRGVLYGCCAVMGQEPTLRTYRSVDNGTTWTMIDALSGLWTGIHTYKDVDLTASTIMRSDDGGVTWQPFHNGFGSSGVVDMSVSWAHVFAVTQDQIYRVPVGSVSSVSGERAAVSGERVIRGSVPWTRVRVERDTDVEVYNVLGERAGTYKLEPGEHLLDTPMPVLLIVKRQGE